MRIIPYEERYRDDLIFMVLQAKDALGRVPRLNPDLLTVTESYLNAGDMFWIALDEADRVIGSIGYHRIPDASEAFLHRLYVKAALKHRGIGTALLMTAETDLASRGIRTIRVHLGAPKEQWFESYSFYQKNGFVEYEPRYMKKDLDLQL